MSTLFVADLDRFLIDTDAANGVLDQVCAGVHMSAQDLASARLSSEVSGGSFDTWGYMRSLGSIALLDEVRQTFIDACKATPIIYDDTATFLATLSEKKIPNLIVTTGGDEWQTIKLEAGELIDQDHLITNEKHKGKMIASWRKESGLYFPVDSTDGAGFETVLLGEDKATGFIGLPDDCGGYLLRRPSERVLKSQQGQVPKQVKTVGGLMEIAEDL